MAFKKGLVNFREYIENEEKICKKIDDRLRERWEQRNFSDDMDQAVLNWRNINLRILKDILQELETDDVKLQVTFSSNMATDLPHLASEHFNEEGIKIEYKGGIFQASSEALQSEFVVFWISSIIGITSGALTIADFIHQKLSKYKNTKMKIGSKEVDPSSKEDLQKAIEEELKRLRKDMDDLREDLEQN